MVIVCNDGEFGYIVCFNRKLIVYLYIILPRIFYQSFYRAPLNFRHFYNNVIIIWKFEDLFIQFPGVIIILL